MNEPQNDDSFRARWVRTSVDILEHPVLDRGPYDRRSAWQWLIIKAAWKPKRVNHKNVILTLERGQVLIGRSYLAKTWGWSEQQVRTFLNQLLAESMLEINQSNGHFANVATICNYEKYQTAQPEQSRTGNQCPTSVQPVSNQTLTKNTNLTNNTSSIVLAEPARVEPSVATPPDDFVGRLVEAAGACLADPVNCMGLITEATPMMWLQSGCDIDRDILPTLRAAAKKYAGKRISTWGYFTPMIAEARQKRLAGLPAITLKPTASSGPVLTVAPKKRSMSDAELEDWKDKIGREMWEADQEFLRKQNEGVMQ